MYYLQLAVLCVTVAGVLGDLPPGTRRNTYLPPVPTKGGYDYPTPTIPFPNTTPPRPPTYPPTRPTPPFPGTRPTYPTAPFPSTRPTYPTPSVTRPRPTPGYPGITGQPSGPTGSTAGHDHHHEPGMPFDFNYAVKEDAFGNDYSHNAISDGEIVRGEYRVQLPDGRTQVVRYTADWQHGFSAQVSYDGNPRFDGSFNRGY